jgi:hypothetical protein
MLVVMYTFNDVDLPILRDGINKHQGKYKRGFTHMAMGLLQQSKTLAKFLSKTSHSTIFQFQFDKLTYRNPTARD